MIIKTLWRILFIGLMVYVLFYVFESVLLIKYPYQISYPEGFLLNQAYSITQGLSIYKDITHYPYLVANYPPLYPLLCALFVKIFGISFAPGRFVSFLSTILSALIIYYIVKKDTANKKVATLSGLVFLSSPYVFYYSPLMRVDALGLLFSLIGIWFVLKNSNKSSIYFSLLFFIAALYIKQTFIAGPIAVVVYLFFKNRWRGFKFFVLLGILYFAIFIILNHLTAGQFYRHNVLYNANPFSITFALRMYISAIQVHAILIALSFIYLLHTIINKDLSLPVIYFIMTAVVTASVGKVGSNVNYFFELLAITCILSGLSLNQLKANINKEKLFNIITTGLLIIQLVLLAHMPYLTGHTPTKKILENARKIATLIKGTPGDILSEDVGLLVLNGKAIQFQPFEFTQLVHQGLWDQTGFVNDIERKKFSLILLTFDINYKTDEERLSPEMSLAIKRNYRLKEIIGENYIYMPFPLEDK